MIICRPSSCCDEECGFEPGDGAVALCPCMVQTNQQVTEFSWVCSCWWYIWYDDVCVCVSVCNEKSSLPPWSLLQPPVIMGFHGSRSVFMIFHGFRLVFHGSRLVFMVPGQFFKVPGRFSWFFMVPGWFSWFFSKMYPPKLYPGPTIQSRSAARRTA